MSPFSTTVRVKSHSIGVMTYAMDSDSMAEYHRNREVAIEAQKLNIP